MVERDERWRFGAGMFVLVQTEESVTSSQFPPPAKQTQFAEAM
jgi:hypothetical protein